ncbi:MAG: hypothetical protein FWC86_00870 [Coriobacteriia bacterium]|nr:hypothetical protein [Coriobacteriia bacterium]
MVVDKAIKNDDVASVCGQVQVLGIPTHAVLAAVHRSDAVGWINYF